MANEKQIKARLQQKHDIEANWNLATNFVPKQGELIVYDKDENYSYERMKIGDGEKTVNALPFIDAQTFDENGVIKQNVLPEGYPYAASGEVLPMTSVSIDPDDGMGMIVDKFSLAEGAEYEVIWNGVSYTCIAKEVVSDTTMAVALGNLEPIGGEYADAPFIIINLDDETALQAGYYGGAIVLDNSTEVSLSITRRATIQKMDNKYLDLEWLPTIVDVYDDGELLCEIDRSTQNKIDGLTFDNILNGQTYIVYYNGTRYIQVARETLSENIPVRYLGNLSINGLDGAINTGEPFVVALGKISETTYLATADDINGSTSFVLSVYTAVHSTEYNKMPEEFLPSSVVSKSDLDGLATEEYVNTQVSSLNIPSIDGLATETYVNNIASTKVDKVDGKGLSTNDYTTTEKNKLSGIASGAEVNQNAFSNVVVGSTTITADSKTDSLTIAAGVGISVAGDATNDKVTITNSGVHAISTGSSNGTISVNTNGTAVDVAIKGLGSAAYTASTAYDAAGTAQTKADAALKSAKTYADGIKNDLLNGAGSAYDTLKELGELIDTNVDAIDALETVAAGKADKTHTHVIADVSGLQSSLDAKVPTSRTINGKALTTDISLTASDVGALPDSTVIPSIAGLATETYVNTQVSKKPGKVVGVGEVFNDLTANQATGDCSHAEGYSTTASGHMSHAEGSQSHAEGFQSHAEGNSCHAEGASSHAEGNSSHAKGDSSHAEGDNTIASGYASHTEGYYTTAAGDYQHVQGRYNLIRENNANGYAHIVGGGGSETNRKDIHTLDWSGNAWFAGDVYVGSTSGKDKDSGSKKLVTESDLSTAIAQKSQVQIITWEADD